MVMNMINLLLICAKIRFDAQLYKVLTFINFYFNLLTFHYILIRYLCWQVVSNFISHSQIVFWLKIRLKTCFVVRRKSVAVGRTFFIGRLSIGDLAIFDIVIYKKSPLVFVYLHRKACFNLK